MKRKGTVYLSPGGSEGWTAGQKDKKATVPGAGDFGKQTQGEESPADDRAHWKQPVRFTGTCFSFFPMEAGVSMPVSSIPEGGGMGLEAQSLKLGTGSSRASFFFEGTVIYRGEKQRSAGTSSPKL